MKRKIFSILFALVLVLTLGLVTAVPAGASPTFVLVGTAHGGPWTTFLSPCFDVKKDYDGVTAYLRVEPFADTHGAYSYDGSLETVNFYVDADNSDTTSMGDFMLEYHHSTGMAVYHYHDGISWVWGTMVSIASLVLPPGMAVTWDDANFPAYVELSIPGTMVPTGVIGVMIYAVSHGAVTNYSANPGPGYGSWDYATWADVLFFHHVGIDIKPGSDPNSINPKSKGLIPVAILGSATFDVTTVDVTTLAFGPNAATPAHDLTDPVVYAEHLQDVNGDGFTDLVSHYRTQATGIAKPDTSATLTGQTTGGIPITGTDAVRIVGK